MNVVRNYLAGGGKWPDPCVCVYPIERYTGATNREIGELFGNLSYSAVAGIVRSVSNRLATEDDLRGIIERMQAEYSYLKA